VTAVTQQHPSHPGCLAGDGADSVAGASGRRLSLRSCVAAEKQPQNNKNAFCLSYLSLWQLHLPSCEPSCSSSLSRRLFLQSLCFLACLGALVVPSILGLSG